ncbi:uncharacterized protein fosp1b.S [Xenopus laevis]|uniref:Uncharacterized protein fosp1b.S n=2 Tax=Xenopus laevis TaxID=8355 RepID=A0A8J0V463_XENLA|nr:uncharacterized protein fosp1b.S [Xenopus laevis]
MKWALIFCLFCMLALDLSYCAPARRLEKDGDTPKDIAAAALKKAKKKVAKAPSKLASEESEEESEELPAQESPFKSGNRNIGTGTNFGKFGLGRKDNDKNGDKKNKESKHQKNKDRSEEKKGKLAGKVNTKESESKENKKRKESKEKKHGKKPPGIIVSASSQLEYSNEFISGHR